MVEQDHWTGFRRRILLSLTLLLLILGPSPVLAEPASILGTWEINLLGQKEVLILSEKSCRMKISGAGLPQRGIEQNKKIAKILPNVAAKTGRIILGPANNLMKPYEVIFWYELKPQSVQLLIGGAQYASVEEAEQKAQGKRALAKNYQRIGHESQDCELLKEGESQGDLSAPKGCRN